MSRGPGSRPKEVRSSALFKVVQGSSPCWSLDPLSAVLSPHPRRGLLSYLAYTSGSTVLPGPSSASLDSVWGLGSLRAPPGSPESTASRRVAGPWLLLGELFCAPVADCWPPWSWPLLRGAGALPSAAPGQLQALFRCWLQVAKPTFDGS